MKKKNKLIILILSLIIVIILIIRLILFLRVKYAKIEVLTTKNMKVEVYRKVRISNFIREINGEIINDRWINTEKLGEQTVKFYFINDDNIKVSYSFKIKVVDTTPPITTDKNKVTHYIGDKDDIAKSLFCGDNFDDKPKCKIVGEYDVNTEGDYQVQFVAVDSSGNETIKDLVINMKVKPESIKNKNINSNDNNDSSNVNVTGTDFKEIKEIYKTKKNKIGIDVSKWQGNIDYKKVKNAGCEFAIIRIGYQKGIDGELIIDPYFEDNIKGFNKVGIPVGVYFFSYAKDKSDAMRQAIWIKSNIKNKNISLPVVFDWENWEMYQEFNLSFKHLSEVADTFMKKIEKYGYQPMLYSSKNYLENIWFDTAYPIWLAHYTDKTDYVGKYDIWQLTDEGIIDGIKNKNIDVDILYERKKRK